MNFWVGNGIFRYQGFEQEIPVRVFQDLDFDLKVETKDVWGFELLLIGQRDDLTLEIKGVTEPIRLLMSHSSTSTSGEQIAVFTPRRSPVWRASSRSLSSGRASLVNFAGFEQRMLNGNRLSLEARGWSLTMIAVNADTLACPPWMCGNEDTVSYQLEFRRIDSSEFSANEMVDFLNDIAEFFSFCHGGWVGIGFAVGLDRSGEVAADEWGIGRLGPADDPTGCLDRFQIQDLQQLFPLFMERIVDKSWADTLSHVTYWLRRSSLENAGPDGGIILLQATLERFAWHVLVRDQESISEKGFSDLTAADQLRLMFNALRLPKVVPEGLEDLVGFARANGLDAAEAFTRVRNRLVHPPKLKAKDEVLPYYDTYRLGRWYAELAVLAACGYRGKYSNRTRKNQWVGQVEHVPWASV